MYVVAEKTTAVAMMYGQYAETHGAEGVAKPDQEAGDSGEIKEDRIEGEMKRNVQPVLPEDAVGVHIGGDWFLGPWKTLSGKRLLQMGTRQRGGFNRAQI